MQRVALELKTFLTWTWTLVGPTFFNQTYFMFFCNWIKCRPLLNLTYIFQISGSSLQVQIHLCKQTTDQNATSLCLTQRHWLSEFGEGLSVCSTNSRRGKRSENLFITFIHCTFKKTLFLFSLSLCKFKAFKR